MDLVQMKCFLDVAETEHVTNSSRRLHMAQPALSRLLHRLEQELGSPLFERAGRNIRLTPAGRLLQRRIEPLVRALDGIEDELAALARDEARAVRINVLSASVVAVEAVGAYRKLHPDARFRIGQIECDAHADILVDTVAVGAADPRLPDGGEVAASLDERILLAVPADYPLQGPEVSAAEVRDEGFICLAGSRRFRRICDDLCLRQGFKPSCSFESDNPSVVRRMIQLGQGIGFWPERSWGALETEGVRFLRIREDFRRRIIVAAAPRVQRTREAAAFLEFFVSRLGAQWR